MNSLKIKKNPKKVRLLGKGTGWEKCPDNDSFEVWGLNGLINTEKKLDRIFIMDVIDEMPSVVSGMWDLKQTISRINELKIPLVAPYKYEEIPLSEAFPLEEAIREFGVPFFNNTIAFMICYALLRGVEELELYGINQASGTEYFYEKGCVEYWLGIATGMGVRVTVTGKHCELLANKERYGGHRLYGYNMTADAFFRSLKKFGERAVKKLLEPIPGKMTYVGPDKPRELRTGDILGMKQLWYKFKSQPGSDWIMGIDDAYNLNRLAVEYKPKRILDLGTGIGFSAAAVKAILPESEVVTLEQFPHLIEQAKKLTESLGIKGIDFRHSDPYVYQMEEIPNQDFIGYKELPDGKWDMVILDGPGAFMDKGLMVNSATKPAGDIFRIVNNINQGGLLYIDGRGLSTNLIQRFLEPQFKLAYKTNNFTVLKRTQQQYDPSKVEDGFKKMLEQQNYFKQDGINIQQGQ